MNLIDAPFDTSLRRADRHIQCRFVKLKVDGQRFVVATYATEDPPICQADVLADESTFVTVCTAFATEPLTPVDEPSIVALAHSAVETHLYSTSTPTL